LYFNCTTTSTVNNSNENKELTSLYSTNTLRNNTTSLLASPLSPSLSSPSASYSNYSTMSPSGLSPQQSTSSNNQMNKLDSNFQAKFINYLSSLSQFSFLFAKMTLDLIEKGNLVIKSSNFKVLPKKMDDLFKLCFNLKFTSRLAYDRLASHIFAVCLASYRPMTLDDLFETLNCAHFNNEKFTMNELLDQITHLDGFLISFSYFEPDFDVSSSGLLIKTNSYAFAHPALRDWWLDYHISNSITPQSSAKATAKSSDSEWGHFLLSMRLFRCSPEFKEKLNTVKYTHSLRIYLDLIKHIIRSVNLLNENSNHKNGNYDSIVYLLSCYLPLLSRRKNLPKPLASNSVYTNLLISAEFLASPEPNLFRVLLRLGADSNANVEYFNSVPFICVLARLGYTKLLQILVNEFDMLFDLNSSCQDQNGINCLSYATQYGHIETAKFILENSKNQVKLITNVDLNGFCALTYCACVTSNKNILDLMDLFVRKLNQNEELTAMDRVKLIQQSLVLSSLNANKKCLNYLISFCVKKTNNSNSGSKLNEAIISIDGVDTLKGETALTAACISGHKSICEMLIETNNASIMTANLKSWTPLLCAVKSGEWEIVEYLLNKNSDIIGQSDKHGRDGLILAASEGHLAIIDILIEKGASLSSHDRDGLNALSWACLKGHYNAALTLLNNGIDINHADFSGRTPLDLATFYGDVRLVKNNLKKFS
jgi:ankyrin repeat protein